MSSFFIEKIIFCDRIKENTDKIKQYNKQYRKQQCLYENELLSLDALRLRFAKKGIHHPTQEAKKYLIQQKWY